jgi:hypothetical protein
MTGYLSDIVYAGDFGAVAGGNPTANRIAFQSAIDTAFGPASSPNGSGIGQTKNRPLIFPPGLFDIDQSLVFTKVQGSRVIGAGRGATWLRNQDGGVLATNGCAYMRIEGFQLTGGPGSTCFDYDWDGAGDVALQATTFADLLFDGTAGASIGINIGKSGYMGSEGSFDNCHFTGFSTAGLITSNGNALAQTIKGGNFQSCNRGIWVVGGSVLVLGSGFQQQADFDIYIETSSINTCHIAGARSESTNFLYLAGGSNCGVYDVDHQGSTHGLFASWNSGNGQIMNCRSTNGRIFVQQNGCLKINGVFDRSDFMSYGSLWPDEPPPGDAGVARIEIVGVATNAGPGIPLWIKDQLIVSDGTGKPVITGS